MRKQLCSKYKNSTWDRILKVVVQVVVVVLLNQYEFTYLPKCSYKNQLTNLPPNTVLDPIKKVCFRSINEAKGGFKRKVKDSERKEVNKRVELIGIVAE